MTQSSATHRPDSAGHLPQVACAALVTLLVAAVMVMGFALHRLAVDDAYITYRYAQNLALGRGFTYNPDRPILSTTAPLYALTLAAGTLVWPDTPALANTLSAVALGLAATLLYTLGRREGNLWTDALAALLLAAYPLLWLSLGLETAAFLALSLGAIVAYRRDQLLRTAALLALAALVRGDGLVLAAVLVADHALGALGSRRSAGRTQAEAPEVTAGNPGSGWWRRLLNAALVFLAVLLPLVLWLTWQFGSPLPATLKAKVAQSELGITGFYAHTTYLQGLAILARARFAQAPLYALFVPAVIAGLIAMWRQAPWVRLLVGWGGAYLAGYALLGVTPYYWYYAPLVPGLASVAALGVVETGRWLSTRLGEPRKPFKALAPAFASLWALALLASLAQSDCAMVRALDGSVPPPEDPVSKVLPEAKASSYRRAGEWLREHTPTSAVVGVTEVGIMGYYSQRHMVDFLGLLEPEVAQALGRGDLYYALLRYQPDYLALTGVSPLYAYDLRADPWFQVAYQPVQIIDDPRFWGSPVTIYQRHVERVPLVALAGSGLPVGAARLDVDLGPIRLLGAIAEQAAVQPGDVLPLTLYWQALQPVAMDYTVFVHLLGQHDRVIAQRDAIPGLGDQTTSQWAPGQIVVDPHLLVLPEAAYSPDEATWEVGLYEPSTGQRLQSPTGADNVRFAQILVQIRETPMNLDFGHAVLVAYGLDHLALSPGGVLGVTLHWGSPETVPITLQLVNESGSVAAQVAGDTRQAAYSLALGPDALPGAYDLEVLAADPLTGQPLPLLGADGQPRGDRARLTKVRLYP